MNTFDENNVINYYNNYIDYNNRYFNIINDYNDNLNIIIKAMEQLDEIKEELTTQEYLDKSNSLYRRYHDLKRRLGN
jgi:hypothetical protein